MKAAEAEALAAAEKYITEAEAVQKKRKDLCTKVPPLCTLPPL